MNIIAQKNVGAVKRGDRPIKFISLVGNGVGRHSNLLMIGREKIFVDPGALRNGKWRVPAKDAWNLLAGTGTIFITHTHLDHVGGLPEMIDILPEARIFATPASKALLKSALLIRRDLREEQVARVVARVREVDYGHSFNIGRSIHAVLLPAGHILGSAAILFSMPEGNILISGDYANEDRGVIPPFILPNVELRGLISEGSFVGLKMPTAVRERDHFLALIGKALAERKSVIVAADPLSVLQEYSLMILKAQRSEELSSFPVFINSWLSDALRIYGAFLTGFTAQDARPDSELSGQRPFCLFAGPGNVSAIFPRRTAQSVLRSGGLIIVDQKYGAGHVTKRLKWNKSRPDDLAGISFLQTGNHITEADLSSLVSQARPEKLVLIHGREGALKAFARSLRPIKGVTIRVPQVGKEIEL